MSNFDETALCKLMKAVILDFITHVVKEEKKIENLKVIEVNQFCDEWIKENMEKD